MASEDESTRPLQEAISEIVKPAESQKPSKPEMVLLIDGEPIDDQIIEKKTVDETLNTQPDQDPQDETKTPTKESQAKEDPEKGDTKPAEEEMTILQRIRHAKQTTVGVMEFLGAVVVILCAGSCVCCLLIVSLFFACLTFIKLIFGIVYFSDCPAKPLIPIYLLVAGIVGIAGTCCRSKEDKKKKNTIGNLLDIFNCFWFGVGCYAIYSIYPPDTDDPTSEIYCNKILYLFSFWTVTIVLGFMGLLLLCFCCFVAVALTN